MEWKRSLYKSIIYRIITVALGTLTTYILTQDIGKAGIIAVATETVQFTYYFIFETLWSSRENKRIRREIENELIYREIDLKIDYNFIQELSYELSQTNTFINSIYTSIMNFYNKLLNNEQLEKLHEKISKYKSYFERVHSGRNFE